MYDFLIVGGGVFGISTAIELRKRKFHVGLINPDRIPHYLAASTDITKVVRMEYGSDFEYFKMAEYCISKWKEYNEVLSEQVYFDIGFLMLSKTGIDSSSSSYEKSSYETLLSEGYPVDLLLPEEIKYRYPSINASLYTDACFNPHGGYVRSGRAIELLVAYARALGVEIHEGQTCEKLLIDKGKLNGLITKEGARFDCGHAIIASGAYTPSIVPALKPYMRATGHPVFWLNPSSTKMYNSDHLPVFMADIANSGFYGFPYIDHPGVMKIAKHADGLLLNPELDDRLVTTDDILDMRRFVSESFPMLSKAPLVYTRRCLYADTLDGHFWIDQHPEIQNLSVSTGGSGHGMKMGPIIGEITADMAEGKEHQYAKRYRWRHLKKNTIQTEEARYFEKRQSSQG